MDTNRGVFTISSVGGIAIKAHWSWIIIFFIVAFDLAAGRFPAMMPGETALAYWSLGIIGSVLLFASVLIHELSHSFTARARGYKVSEIVLFIFGGVSNLEEEPKKAGDEFLISGVGPLSSFALAGIFALLSNAVTPSVGRAGSGAAAIFEVLSVMNWWLALFNMIPGFPLDGGRVLRSIIWGATRNMQTATRIAGGVGQLVAYGFIAWGLFEGFYAGNYGGLWIAFIGWFLLNAARQTTSGVVMREALRGITVAQVMEPSPPSCPPYITLNDLLNQYILPYNLRAVPVARDGTLLGIITLNDIKDVPQEQWATTQVQAVMSGPDKLRVVKPQDGLERAIQLLSEGDFDQLPVADDTGHLVGILTRARVLRWLQIRRELNVPRST